MVLGHLQKCNSLERYSRITRIFNLELIWQTKKNLGVSAILYPFSLHREQGPPPSLHRHWELIYFYADRGNGSDLGMKLSQLVTLHALFKQERYCSHIWHASLKSNHFKQGSFYLSWKETEWEKARDNHHSTLSLLKSEGLCPTSKTTHLE